MDGYRPKLNLHKKLECLIPYFSLKCQTVLRDEIFQWTDMPCPLHITCKEHSQLQSIIFPSANTFFFTVFQL